MWWEIFLNLFPLLQVSLFLDLAINDIDIAGQYLAVSNLHRELNGDDEGDMFLARILCDSPLFKECSVGR
jgi:hypothetical protein